MRGGSIARVAFTARVDTARAEARGSGSARSRLVEKTVKMSVDDVDVRGKRVLVRLDLNVPLDASGTITDDRRIRSALPTVRKLIDGGARVILMSHLGRPKGGPDDRRKFSLARVASRLGELLGKSISFVDDGIGDAVDAAVTGLADGDVCLLESRLGRGG